MISQSNLNGSKFYDDNAVFDQYSQLRQKVDNANDTLEKPIMQSMLGTVKGLDILDLGCGDGKFGLELLKAGANSYLGVDGSHNMIEAARHNLALGSGQVVQASLEEWDYPIAKFDLIVSRLVLHYIKNLTPVLDAIHQSLKPDGAFIFSVEHPTNTCRFMQHSEINNEPVWFVVNYFVTGIFVDNWLGGKVEKYHRTIEDYFTALTKAKFKVTQLREANPQPQHFSDPAVYEKCRQVPLFLFLAGQK